LDIGPADPVIVGLHQSTILHATQALIEILPQQLQPPTHLEF